MVRPIVLRSGFLALAVSCCVIALSRPADAAVSATFSMVGPNPLTASCPVTVNFTGAITGPPNTNVTYIFSHFQTGGPVISAPTNATIPANGTLPITESIVVDTAHAGFQSNEIDVTSPNAAQGKVFFTVNCSPITVSTPTPKPHFIPANGQSGLSGAMAEPYPDGLANTESAKTCGAHGGFAGLFCPQALHDGWLVLVWNWEGTQFHPKADGYRVYRVDSGLHMLVDTQANQQNTISLQKPITGGFGGKCYAVTAFAGSLESRLSPQFCVPSGYTGRQAKSLSTNNWAFHYHQYSGCGGGGLCVTGTKCDDLCIGFQHIDTGGGPTLQHINTWWRGYVLFDPGQIQGLNVFKATLNMRVVSGDPTCFGSIGAAKGLAFNTSDVPDGDWEDVPHSLSSSAASFDVTDIVKQWARGATPNFGFALKGPNEDTGANDNGGCMLDFNPNASLTIEFY